MSKGDHECSAEKRPVFPTELGPCMVRFQQGTRGPCAASGTPEVYLHGAAGSWTTFQALLSRVLLSGAPAHDRVLIDLPG